MAASCICAIRTGVTGAVTQSARRAAVAGSKLARGTVFFEQMRLLFVTKSTDFKVFFVIPTTVVSVLYEPKFQILEKNSENFVSLRNFQSFFSFEFCEISVNIHFFEFFNKLLKFIRKASKVP